MKNCEDIEKRCKKMIERRLLILIEMEVGNKGETTKKERYVTEDRRIKENQDVNRKL